MQTFSLAWLFTIKHRSPAAYTHGFIVGTRINLAKNTEEAAINEGT